MKRHATSVWEGTGKEGKGNLTTQSTILNNTQYSFSSRFEEGIGTNPEELVAAAHAGCFNMKLSFLVVGAGLEAEKLETKCIITLEDGTITNSHLILNAKIPGMDESKFNELVAEAEATCPVSKLLNAAISVDSTLVS